MTDVKDLVTIDDDYDDLKKFIQMFTRHAVHGVEEAKVQHQVYVESGEHNKFQHALDYMHVTQAQNMLRVSINQALINYFFGKLTEKKIDD